MIILTQLHVAKPHRHLLQCELLSCPPQTHSLQLPLTLLVNSRGWPAEWESISKPITGPRKKPTSDEKSSNGAASTTLMVSLLLGCTVANPPETTTLTQEKRYTMEYNYLLNHFFEALLDSMTSTTPGRKGSIDGTWFARIPMSPVAAETFT